MKHSSAKRAWILLVVPLASVALGAEPPSRRPTSVETELGKTFPVLRARLERTPPFEARRATEGAAPFPGLVSRPDPQSQSFTALFPRSYSQAFSVEAGPLTVALRPLGAQPAFSNLGQAGITYASAYPETDVFHTTEGERAEEFLLLRSPRAPRRFEYEVLPPVGVTRVFVRDGAVFFTADDGEGLVIVPPLVLDAEGRRSSRHAAWTLGEPSSDGHRRLTLSLDPTGLVYPLAVDPTWTTTGSLAQARWDSSIVLLHSGKVLAFGYVTTSELYDPATGVWSPTGSMPATRQAFTATLLRDGRVLVAGGDIGSGTATSTCFIYNPLSGAWAAAASMPTARMDHSATLLPDGRVLVSGGSLSSSPGLGTFGAAIYDPVLNTWAATLTMPNSRRSHTSTLLRDGRVLVTGGVNSASTVSGQADIFNPATGLWTPTAAMARVRADHMATLLPSGNVLVAGGTSSTPHSEIYDTTNNTWVAAGNMLASPRYDATANLLPDGRVLVAGSGGGPGTEIFTPTGPTSGTWTSAGSMAANHAYAGGVVLPNGKILVATGFWSVLLNTADLFDPSVAPTTSSWTATGSLATQRDEHNAVLLADGRVLAVGGVSTSTAEIFDASSATWSPTGGFNVPRYRNPMVLLGDGRVLAPGGSYLDSAEVYDPGTSSWSLTGTMTVARSGHTATLLPCGEVLVTGGESSSGVRLSSAEIYNPVTGTWRATGSMAVQRWNHAATLLTDGRVLVTGGWSGGAPSPTAEVYDHVSGTWSSVGSMSVGRYHHTATLLPSGRVLVVGKPLSVGASAELFDPVGNTFSVTGNPVVPRDTHQAVLLPNGKVLVAGGFASGITASAESYDPATAGWTTAANLAVGREYYTLTLLPDGRVLAAAGLSNSGLTATAELFDVGRGEQATWRPALASATNPLVDAQPLNALGTGFQGLSEAASGGENRHSATNYPLVQLRRIDNEAVRWLPVSGASLSWSNTSFLGAPVTGFQPGQALVTVFTNGIPSLSRTTRVECLPPTVLGQPSPQTVCAGQTAVFTVAGSGTCPSYQWRKDGVPLTEGGRFTGTQTATLNIANVASSDAGDYDAVVSLACSSSIVVSNVAALVVTPTLQAVAATLSGAPTVCSTCTGGTAFESHSGGGIVTYQWGFRTVSAGPTTALPGQTGGSYVLNGADFPGLGTYFLVVTTTPTCGTPLVSNEITVLVNGGLPTDTVQVLTVTSKNGQNVVEWLNPPGFSTVRIRFNSGPAGCTFPGEPLASGTLLADVAGAPDMPALVPHNGLNNGHRYCYTAFVNTGGGYSSGRSVSGRPFDNGAGQPQEAVKWAYSTGATATAPPAIGSVMMGVSNDRILHSVVRGTGATAGLWPAGYRPLLLNGPAQSRPPVVAAPIVALSSQVVLLGSQDGYVYAVDAPTGGPRWQSAAIGDVVQGAPAGIFTAFGGAFDYVLVGSRNASADNVIYALDPATGGVAASFDNGGGAGALGIISAGAAVDYSTSRVYFTSRAKAGGSSDTLWCLQIGSGTLALAWSRDVGNVDGAPVLRGGVVYVGNNAGEVHALDAASGLPRWAAAFATGDGPVKGFIFPNRDNGDLYLATSTKVWSLTDLGPSAGLNWSLQLAPAVTPSIPLFVRGTPYIYSGGSDGRLYELRLGGAVPTVKSVLVGAGANAVGAPSFDAANGLVYVGTEGGVFYAVASPLP